MTLRGLLMKDGRVRPVLRCAIYLAAVVAADVLLTGVVVVALGLKPATALGPNGPSSELLFVSELSLCIAIVAASFFFRRGLDRRSWASLGLNAERPWLRLLAIGLLLGAAMQCFIFAVDEALGYSHVTGFSGALQDGTTALTFVPTFALVAVAEELSMRGYLFQNLWEEWGVVPAIVLTSLLFAAAHLGNPNSHANLALTVAGLLAYGVWACASVLWTRSLWPAVGVHFAWNVFEGPVLGFPVSGLQFSSTAIRQTVGGPVWFTGGPFGPESGASAIVALALGLVVLFWLWRRGAFADTPDRREAYALDQKSSSLSSPPNSSSSSP
jgi:CAAX protease family protein